MQLFPDQEKLVNEIIMSFYTGAQNVLAVAPTGAGKTVIKAAVALRLGKLMVAMAHRQELVSQISVAFARMGIYHRLLAPEAVVKFCVRRHMAEVGKSYHYASSDFAVGGVDTILRRFETYQQFLLACRFWEGDEAHHFLPDNKWGRAIKPLQDKGAWGLGVTATPRRTDRKPLRGVFNRLVLGPTPGELIRLQRLSNYRIFGMPPSYTMDDEEDVSKTTGDYKPDALRKKSKNSRIVGDIVETYLANAPGELGIGFAVSVEQAIETANAFIQKGVPAMALSGESSDEARQGGIDRFKRGDIKFLMNVDLFDEGFDVPGASYVAQGRKTLSIIKHKQQMGRVLRVEPGKTHGKIADHVGNCVTLNCVPDTEFAWSLDGSEKKTETTVKLKTCVNPVPCYHVFPAYHKACPRCGHIPEPESRSAPEYVDGDLIEFDEALIAKLRGEIKRVDGPALVPVGVADYVRKGIENRWEERQVAQHELRDCISQWAGIRKYVHERDDSQIYREFYLKFGIDIANAQTLGAPDARKLTANIREEWV